ncbi:hypothetical protein KP509_32G007600 [Ceratopteris richardii]|nr:hypothetical protein KP509_32G007600 [Ceratopteris richardii]
MYSKCDYLTKAVEVFYNLPTQDTVTWNVLISGYIQYGLCKEALNAFEEMQVNGLVPNCITFASILKCCGIICAAIEGHHIHNKIMIGNLSEDYVLISNALIDMYGKCGLLESAWKVFQGLETRDVISWNALITAYTNEKQCDEAKKCYERMLCESLSPSPVSYACILKACGSLGDLNKGEQIHAQNNQSLFQKGKMLANALLDMYIKNGALDEAQEVFDNLLNRDVASWTLIIGCYAQERQGEEAVTLFERMQCEGICPNSLSFVAVLRAYGNTKASECILAVHSQVHGEPLYKKDIMISNALINAYMKCSLVSKALELFNDLAIKDSVSWNVLISGYAQVGHSEEALSFYELMETAGFSPDPFTYACICKACANLCAVYQCQQIFTNIVNDGLFQRDIVTSNSLLDMLSKCSMLKEAHEVFDRLPSRDIISWNSLIAGYAQHEHFAEALTCFEQMQDDNFAPDAFTFASVVRACGDLGASSKGQEIHVDMVKYGSLETDMVLGTALVHMYATFGMLGEAQDVFDKLPFQDSTSFNALLTGYAQSGKIEFVIELFSKFIEYNIKLDSATFSNVLNMYIHTGLLEDAQLYFKTMVEVFITLLTIDHFNCLADLFGRAGDVEKAALVIKEMPFHSNFAAWITFLGACQNCRHAKLGRWAFENASELTEKDAAAHVLMSNIYAAISTYHMTGAGL